MSSIAWSFSRVKDFTKCAYMFYMKSVAPKHERVKFVETDAMRQGKLQHKMLQDRVQHGTPIPADYANKLDPIAKSIIMAEGTTFAELELALDENLNPCGYRDWDRAWVRVIIDIMKINKNKAFVGDYKTGTPDFDETQLKLFAAVVFHEFPEVDEVTTAYIWLKTGTLDTAVYKREQLPALWAELLVAPQKMQYASAMNLWPKRPGRWCKWCDVNRELKCDRAQERYRG